MFRQNVTEDFEDIGQFCLTLSEYADVIGIRKPSHQYLTNAITCWSPLELTAFMSNPDE